MKYGMLSLVLLAGLVACQSTPSPRSAIAHGDGASPDRPVDLSAAHSEGEGIAAQRNWLDQHYPGARIKSQSLLFEPSAMDLITVVLPSGEEREVYFDISSYFGKW
ncbi:hypothetical protein ACP93_13595 [Xanthomonas sp. NCPPB 1128]|nr:hypothetical protein ACP93_13595 [Xanthomonas sp. NCPPB 1128]